MHFPPTPQLRAAVVDEAASGLAMVDPAVFEAHGHRPFASPQWVVEGLSFRPILRWLAGYMYGSKEYWDLEHCDVCRSACLFSLHAYLLLLLVALAIPSLPNCGRKPLQVKEGSGSLQSYQLLT